MKKLSHNDFIVEEISKSGDITLKYHNVYLHSKYFPKEEAKRFVNENYNSASIQILLGYGAGYIYEELEKKLAEHERIIVVDPLIKPIKKEGIIYLETYEEESIKTFLNDNLYITDSINMIISINYEKIVEKNKEFHLFLKNLQEKMSSNQISENTITYFNLQWNENYLRNLKYAFQDHSIEELFSNEKFPVVVAAGGPSLSKQITLIKKYRNKIVLVAAGTTINSLLKYDIKPDIVVSVDGGEINFKHFESLTIKDFPLVYCPTVHHGIREKFTNAYYCFLNMEEQLIPHYQKYTEKNVKTLIGGSSVANTAYNLALFLSQGPVALIGQDLAYTNEQSHAEGNLNRKSTVNENTILREGYHGDMVKTTPVFIQMKEGFELIQAVMNTQSRTYNCTEGGMKIDSIQQETFAVFLDKFADKELDKKYSYKLTHYKDNLYMNKLIEDERIHLKLISLFNKAIMELDRNSSEIQYDLDVLKNLEYIDQEIKVKLKDSNLNYAFSVVNLHVLRYFKVKQNATNKEKYQASYKQSKYMYEEMLKITKKSMEITKELIREGDINGVYE